MVECCPLLVSAVSLGYPNGSMLSDAVRSLQDRPALLRRATDHPLHAPNFYVPVGMSIALNHGHRVQGHTETENNELCSNRPRLAHQLKLTASDYIPEAVHVRLEPAPPLRIRVRRTDLGGFEIPPPWSLWPMRLRHHLNAHGGALDRRASVGALRGSNIENVFIEVDNLEIPILDGSRKCSPK